MANVIFASSGVTTVTLTSANVEYGNAETYQFARTIRKTIGGDFKSLYNTDRQAVERISVTLRWLTTIEVSDLRVFILATIGKPITYTDHNGTVWSVIILTPTNGFITEGRQCSFNISLEMQVL